MEEWRTIKDFENYEISNMGRVRSLPHVVTQKGSNGKMVCHPYDGRVMKPTITKGYYKIGLPKDGKYYNKQIHRLVAEAFIPNPDNLPVVNHKDENPLNNTVENLEWCTVQYNSTYGTVRERLKEKLINNPKKSKPVGQYTLDGELVKVWPSTKEAGRNGYNQAAVNYCCLNKPKYNTHKGYRWQYLN